jgi:hypothetical protein
VPMERLPYRLVLYSESAMVGQFRTGYGYLWWGKRYSAAQAPHKHRTPGQRSGPDQDGPLHDALAIAALLS